MKQISTSLLLLACCLLGSAVAKSQLRLQPREAEPVQKGVIYNSEWSASLRLLTGGYGLSVNWGKIDAFDKLKYYSISLDFLRHPKEYRQNIRPSIYNPLNRPFVYGKQNHFFNLKAGIGKKLFLSEKAKRRGVAIGYLYEGGISLGIIKPYYLEMLDIDFPNNPRDPIVDVKYTEETADRFLNINEIQGFSGFFTGFDELRFIPGLYGRTAVHFSWGAYDKYVKAFDIGVMVEIYPRSIPIMLIAENRPYFLNLYVSLHLGKRN